MQERRTEEWPDLSRLACTARQSRYLKDNGA